MYLSPGRFRGRTSAVEGGRAYAVRYEIDLDDAWRTPEVRVWCDGLGSPRSTVLTSDGAGIWTVDGVPAPDLHGLVDGDLGASACINMLPVHRLELPVGEVVAAAATYLAGAGPLGAAPRATYRRRDARTFDYRPESGAFRAVLTYDVNGLAVDYPGIAVPFA